MTKIDITPEFIAFMDRVPLNPLNTFTEFSLDSLTDLGDAFDLEGEVSTTLSSTGIVGRQGNITVEITGTGISPATTLDAFTTALGNGTARGTLTGIEVREGSTVLLEATLTGTALTVNADDLQFAIQGTFPTDLMDVVDLFFAFEEFAVDFESSTPAERAEMEALLARYNLTSATLREGGQTLTEITLSAEGVEVALPQDVTVSFNGSFAGGLNGSLASLGLISSVLTTGDYYREDDIDLENLVITGPDDVPFATLSGPFTDGDFLGLAQVFVDGQEKAYYDLGSGARADVFTARDSAGGDLGVVLAGFDGADTLTGGQNADLMTGGLGNDRLSGLGADDMIYGGDGTDVIIGGNGNDMLFGGSSEADLRDVIYGGAGNDNIDGGYGNDELRGDAGNDVIAGGFGADSVLGGAGNDTLTGSALGDLLFGGDGDDFVNGGFGFDRVNGGAGADDFYHLGVANHGADWIQDFGSGEGDVLVFGNARAREEQFQVNIATTTGAGEDGVDEAFVVYRPTGQIMWALVDGAGQEEINLQIGGSVFDLMA